MATKKASDRKSAPKKSTSTKAAGGKPTKKRPSGGIADRAAPAVNAAAATTTDAVRNAMRAAGEATGIGGANKKRRGAKQGRARKKVSKPARKSCHQFDVISSTSDLPVSFDDESSTRSRRRWPAEYIAITGIIRRSRSTCESRSPFFSVRQHILGAYRRRGGQFREDARGARSRLGATTRCTRALACKPQARRKVARDKASYRPKCDPGAQAAGIIGPVRLNSDCGRKLPARIKQHTRASGPQSVSTNTKYKYGRRCCTLSPPKFCVSISGQPGEVFRRPKLSRNV